MYCHRKLVKGAVLPASFWCKNITIEVFCYYPKVTVVLVVVLIYYHFCYYHDFDIGLYHFPCAALPCWLCIISLLEYWYSLVDNMQELVRRAKGLGVPTHSTSPHFTDLGKTRPIHDFDIHCIYPSILRTNAGNAISSFQFGKHFFFQHFRGVSNWAQRVFDI